MLWKEKPAQSRRRFTRIEMALYCKLCYLTCLAAVAVSALDLSELELDTALNPRLVGAVYHLYKPDKPTKVTPITIDCNHPSVICRFGTSALVSPDKECNCNQASGSVPIISGLTAQEEKVADIKEKGGNVAVTTDNKQSGVPVYSGVIDTNAVLNEERPYNIWNYQKNSMDKGWRPIDDPSKARVGELPSKYASYYPFSDPKPNMPGDFPDFPPGSPDEPPRFIFWRKPGTSGNMYPNWPTPAPNVRNPTTRPSIKTTKKPSHTSTVVPKRNV